jgi:hypothetical protein
VLFKDSVIGKMTTQQQVNFGLELPRYEVYMKTDDPNAKICLNYQTPRDKAL